ncbi:MAG: hypothetical protein RLZZ245_2341 [Verrucomicrobiota bacterium]
MISPPQESDRGAGYGIGFRISHIFDRIIRLIPLRSYECRAPFADAGRASHRNALG